MADRWVPHCCGICGTDGSLGERRRRNPCVLDRYKLKLVYTTLIMLKKLFGNKIAFSKKFLDWFATSIDPVHQQAVTTQAIINTL